jgi:hypothetical protein
MIVATQFVFSLVIALSISFILSLFLSRERPRTGFFFFFLILFLVTLAGGLWVRPFGPSLFGVFWVPIILVGLVSGLFLYQSAPRHPPHNRKETIQLLEEEQQYRQLEKITYVSVDFIFWLIIVLLVVAVIYRFIWPL